MKTKKFLAASLAAAMMVSTLPAATANAEEIEGGVIYVKQDIYDVTLPTTAAQKFYLDPEGLIALGNGGSATANPGTVVGLTNMYAVNRSSIPVVLSASYKVADSATADGVTVVKTVSGSSDITDVQEAATKKVAISISAIEAAMDADTSGNTCGGKVFKADASGVDVTASTGNLSAAEAVYADSATAVAAEYVMTPETYKFQLKDENADPYDANSYEYIIDSTAKKASCVKLTIGGYCSTKADWSAYTDGTNELKLDMTFKFKKAATTTGDWTDTTTGTDEVKTGPQVSMTAGGLITISDLTADKNVTGFDNLKLSNGTSTAAPQASTATFSDSLGWTSANGGTCTFQLGSAWNQWNGDSVTVTVTLTDGSTIKCAPVTLAIQ